MYEPTDPTSARNELGALYSRTERPDAAADALARTKLATAKIDKAIRDAVAACPAPLHPAQVEYLVGRITSAGGA
ncbi:hypothetical protein [Nocardioides sp. Leaf307]|uniref:hypothetical protein n=1 Tax=Nocardioides sp. Leaf307 TaxID=1736331 RepID=UPI00070390C5|nr:hypothetical protein [Nocardioides sp. Leaf307]KQQ43086.1 hypothetical protein ASF50_03570 [Nocardioides sp. Leaf307]